MTTYLFQGLILPERAQMSLERVFKYAHVPTTELLDIRISIILNQIAVWVGSDKPWEVYDLRNLIKTLVSYELEVISFLKGLTYDVEITRVINLEQGVDYVFGVGDACISERNKDVDVLSAISQIREQAQNENGIFLRRCFSDLAAALKNADDTGFYCYRAIESLRQHAKAKFGIESSKETEQWEKLRAHSGCSEETLREIRNYADAAQHREPANTRSEQRRKLLLMTWDVVDGYLKSI